MHCHPRVSIFALTSDVIAINFDFSDYTYERYDPDNVEHQKFEIKVKPPCPSAKDDEVEALKAKKKQLVQKVPEVSKDTFYSVNESIKDLFGKVRHTFVCRIYFPY